MKETPDISTIITTWAKRARAVKALVLFGSRARPAEAVATADRWSDVDLHLITDAPEIFESQRWARNLPGLDLCLYVVRPASGDVRKATLIFSTGEADVVVIPLSYIRRLRRTATSGLSGQSESQNYALNEMATVMKGGYRFLKGEKDWGSFYTKVSIEFPGRRLTAEGATKMADIFVCDLLGVFQKIERGEFVVAQRLLHRQLAEANFQLLHEARLRRNQPTFREARRAERLLSGPELAMVQVTTGLDAKELRQAVGKSFAAMRKLMAELVPDWRVPDSIEKLLAPYLRVGQR